jgi:hypothetical protein
LSSNIYKIDHSELTGKGRKINSAQIMLSMYAPKLNLKALPTCNSLSRQRRLIHLQENTKSQKSVCKDTSRTTSGV